VGSPKVKISDAFNGVQRVALDTAPLIYLVENHPDYADRMDEIVDHIEEHAVQAFTSALTLTEVLVVPKRNGDSVLEAAYKSILLNGKNLSLVTIDATTADLAANLRAKYSLRTPDALQVASAIVNKCDAILTNDQGLKRVTELRVLVLDELDI
jgi:predicted nucleic acid-binding protein